MSKLKVNAFSISIDGYGAGPRQSLENPPQVWNMPSAPAKTPRQLLQIGADELGLPLKLTAIPLWLLPVVGLFNRSLEEVWDVRYTWDRPYEVDASKFRCRFDFAPTPFEIGIRATARSFADIAEKTRQQSEPAERGAKK